MSDDLGSLPQEPADSRPPVVCWRCGKTAPATAAVCPSCRAALSASAHPLGPDARSAATPQNESTALLRTIGVYSAMLLISLGIALVNRPQLFASGPPREPTRDELLTPIVVLEVADALLLVVAILWIE